MKPEKFHNLLGRVETQESRRFSPSPKAGKKPMSLLESRQAEGIPFYWQRLSLFVLLQPSAIRSGHSLPI